MPSTGDAVVDTSDSGSAPARDPTTQRRLPPALEGDVRFGTVASLTRLGAPLGRAIFVCSARIRPAPYDPLTSRGPRLPVARAQPNRPGLIAFGAWWEASSLSARRRRCSSRLAAGRPRQGRRRRFERYCLADDPFGSLSVRSAWGAGFTNRGPMIVSGVTQGS
jgi:hypothetical protein